jgi:hypothetical protein
MSWYVRQSSHLDRLFFDQLLELYTLMKRWKEQLPELSWTPSDELEHVLKNRKIKIEELLFAETAQEMLQRVSQSLKDTLKNWDHSLQNIRKQSGSALGRLLRFTEEEALRYTSEQWKKFKPEQFKSVAPVYSAYRETPFYALYRSEVIMVRQTGKEIIFLTQHPLLEMEQAWMRGFVMYLRPSVQVDQKVVGDHTAFHWWES